MINPVRIDGNEKQNNSNIISIISGQFWPIIDEADQVINHHFEISDMICLAERFPSNTIVVYHFDKKQPFGLDERHIDEFITDRFRSAQIDLNSSSMSARLINDMGDLMDHIRHRNYYLKDICFSEQSGVVYLFGLPKLVKSCRDEFAKLQHNQEAQPCRITLSEEQVFLHSTLSSPFTIRNHFSSIILFM